MFNQPHVLYVEDDLHSRKLMRRLLTNRMGLQQVTIFENSLHIVNKVKDLDPKPDVIFLDIHLRPFDGFEILEMLRQVAWLKTTPIVALTASVMNEEVQQLRTVGFDGCLAKPIDLATFADTFQRILDGETIWRIIEY